MHAVVHETGQLGRGERGAALREPRDLNLAQVVARDLDAARRLAPSLVAMAHVIAEEQQQPDYEEVQQRFPQPGSDRRAQREAAAMGASWPTAGTIS